MSDVVNNTSNDVGIDDASDNDDASDDYASNADVFLMDAWDIMNRASRKIRTVPMEDRRFRSFFGIWKKIVKMVWNMLGEGGLHSKKSEPKHLLWALYFLKVYPREGPGCCQRVKGCH